MSIARYDDGPLAGQIQEFEEMLPPTLYVPVEAYAPTAYRSVLEDRESRYTAVYVYAAPEVVVGAEQFVFKFAGMTGGSPCTRRHEREGHPTDRIIIADDPPYEDGPPYEDSSDYIEAEMMETYSYGA